MSKINFLTLVVLLPLYTIAQTTKNDDIRKMLQTTNKDTVAWLHGGALTLGVNEGFLHNWSSGGELASMTANGIFNGHLDHLHHTSVWSNTLSLNYGLNYAYSTGFLPHKTDDRIDFTSKFGHKIDSSKYFYFTGLANFKSQFTKGYNYQLTNWDSASTSNFFSPAYVTAALGFEYRKGTNVSIFISPAASRMTFASRYYTRQSPQGQFGIPYGKTSVQEFGAYITGTNTWQIKKNTVLKSRVDLYSNYLAKDTKDSTGKVIKSDNPGNVYVFIDNLLTWKISKYFNVTTGLTLIYDNSIPYVKPAPTPVQPDSDPASNLGWVQIKQVFALGIEYKF